MAPRRRNDTHAVTYETLEVHLRPVSDHRCGNIFGLLVARVRGPVRAGLRGVSGVGVRGGPVDDIAEGGQRGGTVTVDSPPPKPVPARERRPGDQVHRHQPPHAGCLPHRSKKSTVSASIARQWCSATAILVANDAFKTYVQERLSETVTPPGRDRGAGTECAL